MIDLAEKKENFDIPLIGQIKVTVKPITTASMVAAQTAAARRVREIIEPYEQCVASGLVPDSLDFDLSDPDTLEGLRVKFLIEELAIRHIVAWEGVSYDGNPAPLEPKMIAALMGENPIGQTFFHQLTIKQVERFSAKKDSGVVATGISAAAPTIVKDVTTRGPVAQKDVLMQMERSALMTNTD